jgi:hypothetical protein
MSLPTSFSWILSQTSPSGNPSTQGSGAGNRTSGNGKTGIAVPFSSDGRGRLALVSGDNQLSKIIMLNLSDLDSTNPYQGDIGIGAEMVFAIASTRLRADIRRRINALFRRLQLQDRARLDGAPDFVTDSSLQEVTCSITYINLEENKPGQVGLKFSLANSVS